jgi:transposase
MTPAVLAFVEALLARNAALEARVADLEAHLRTPGKNPRNSSQPPASVHPHAKPAPERPPSSKPPGGQLGHPKAERALVPSDRVTTTVPLKPARCRRCGARLVGSDPAPVRHQVWELPACQPLIIEYRRHRLVCPRCATVTAAPLPEGVPRGQSGPRLTAAVGVLMAWFRQSKRRVGLLLEALFGIPCSAGWAVKLQGQVTQALAPCYQELRQALRTTATAALDESPTKEGKAKAWLWTAVTPQFTVLAQRPSRAADLARELLGPDDAGVVTSDRYPGYDWLPLEQRQLCWAHLRRDFQALVDAGGPGQRIGRRLVGATRQLFHEWHRFRQATITRATLRRRLRPVQAEVYDALETGTLCRQASTAGTCGHILDRFDALWTFLDHAGVEPTNNAAERALRHGVIWRKLSFGTQSAAGSRFVETLLSVSETCRQQGRRVWDFVTRACQALVARQPAPQLLTAP